MISDVPSPTLLVDLDRMQRNAQKMRERAKALGVRFRPHVKTHKCTRILDVVFGPGDARAITVSTLREAEVFADAGVRDILYGVGITNAKLPRVKSILEGGARLSVVVDTLESASQLVDYAEANAVTIPVWIEIDADGHRAGVPSGSPRLIEIGRVLTASSSAEFVGVMTHAGASYGKVGAQALSAHAELERSQCVEAAQKLRSVGIACPNVSVGSTPTATFAEHLEQVTELRAGVYVFQDLYQAGLRVCDLDDIALSVLCTVIGVNAERGLLITDAGWMALSRDRGTASQDIDYGYGQVCALNGEVIDDTIVASANQEHGIIAKRGDGTLDLRAYPIGTRLRILPNHACATAAQHDGYIVVSGESVVDRWSRANGW